jgi:hypothetical protein
MFLVDADPNFTWKSLGRELESLFFPCLIVRPFQHPEYNYSILCTSFCMTCNICIIKQAWFHMPLKLIEQSLYTQKEKEKKFQITVPYGKYTFLENK